jgi:hypothetical protein
LGSSGFGCCSFHVTGNASEQSSLASISFEKKLTINFW